jgi:protein involved in ribonucleotide reduction
MMTDQEIRDDYHDIMYTGDNTREKHVRQVAERLVTYLNTHRYARICTANGH